MPNVVTKKELSPEQREELLIALRDRFEKNMKLHKGLEWVKVQSVTEYNRVRESCCLKIKLFYTISIVNDSF